MIGDAYVEAIVRAAERDASIARVLREICALVGAHLRAHAAACDVLECVQALGEEAVARRIAERLGPPG